MNSVHPHPPETEISPLVFAPLLLSIDSAGRPESPWGTVHPRVATPAEKDGRMKIREFHVRPNLPPELKPLQEIAMNLWFSWNWEAVQLLIRLSPDLWQKSYQNPVLMLGSLSQENLEAADRDESFAAKVKRGHKSRVY